MNRTAAWRRHKDISKALRKKNISDRFSWDRDEHYYSNLHQYSKNKIHCSCPMCATKTRSRACYGRIYNPPIRDIKKIKFLDDQIGEYCK